ncbi:uncharacterized protein LOC125501751 [Athalia rosae]|uniref:uncharacterized protein LOC125501751 n=1 Tax=Athalia rosae TaxID=37344 RepID=UPI002033C95E|nr:uncharacterized protein LOC125501751 [Athalia rosae]
MALAFTMHGSDVVVQNACFHQSDAILAQNLVGASSRRKEAPRHETIGTSAILPQTTFTVTAGSLPADIFRSGTVPTAGRKERGRARVTPEQSRLQSVGGVREWRGRGPGGGGRAEQWGQGGWGRVGAGDARSTSLSGNSSYCDNRVKVSAADLFILVFPSTRWEIVHLWMNSSDSCG